MRKLHEDDLTDLLRERLRRHEEQPDDDVWSRIQARRDRTPVWARWAEPISVLAIAAFLAFGLSPRQHTAPLATRSDSAKAALSPSSVNPVTTKHEVPGRTADQPTVVTQGVVETAPDVLLAEVVLSVPVVSVAPDQEVERFEALPSVSAAADTTRLIETVHPKKRRPSRLQVYFSVSPGLAFQRIRPVAGDQLIVEGLAYRPSLSGERFGISVDAGLQKEVSKTISVYAGLSFYRQRQQLAYYFLENETQASAMGDIWSIEVNPVRRMRSFDYSMTNLGLKTGILRTWKGERLKHRAGVGVMFVQGFARTEGSYANQRSWYVAGQWSYRAEYRINEAFSFLVEPSLSYTFLSNEKLDEPFRLTPYRVGLGAGLLYRFGSMKR